MIRSVLHVSFASQETEEQKWSERDPTISLHFLISKPSDSAFLSHSALFSFCTRCLPVFEMKYTCLAAFKESQNTESHLCYRAVHSPFYIQYEGDDQKDQNWGRSYKMSPLE